MEERNGTCQVKKRKLEWFNLMKPSPFHHDDHLGFCSVTTSMYFCMVTGITVVYCSAVLTFMFQLYGF